MDHKSKGKMCKTLRRKHRRKSSWPEVRPRVLRSDTKAQSIKSKKWLTWASSKFKTFTL